MVLALDSNFGLFHDVVFKLHHGLLLQIVHELDIPLLRGVANGTGRLRFGLTWELAFVPVLFDGGKHCLLWSLEAILNRTDSCLDGFNVHIFEIE